MLGGLQVPVIPAAEIQNPLLFSAGPGMGFWTLNSHPVADALQQGHTTFPNSSAN